MYRKFNLILLTTITTLLLPLQSFSFFLNCTIDDISYDLFSPEKIATVKSVGYNTEKNLVIPSTIIWDNVEYKVVSIAGFAFSGCNRLTSIEIPNTVTSIGSEAFNKCSNLTSIYIPNSVTSIKSYAFHSCKNLKSITIPNSVTDLSYSIFYDCDSLQAISLPERFRKTKLGIHSSVKVTYLSHQDYKIFEMLENLKKCASIKDLIKKYSFESWEDYHSTYAKCKPITIDKESLEKAIAIEIEKWQTKGEFESTAEWKTRVNENSRLNQINLIKKQLIQDAQAYEKEYNSLLAQYKIEYKNYYNPLIEEFYKFRQIKKAKEFADQDFEINTPYDADNETFLISTSTSGDILLRVPRPEAPAFKANFESIIKNIKPVYIPSGDDVVLSKIEFTNGGKTYTYDSKTEAKYAIADITYDFKPVKLSDTDLDLSNINLPALSNNDVNESNKVIAKQTTTGIAQKKVNITRNQLKVGNGSAEQMVDVDINIPINKQQNNNTVALIIANENYKNVSRVEAAIHDGEVIAQYCEQTLGIPKTQILKYQDASLADIYRAISILKGIVDAMGDNTNVMVYYAGHGMPDEATKDAYILPTDGDAQLPPTCYSLKKFYEELSALKSANTFIFLDACFSGSQRGEGMLTAARGVKIKPKDVTLSGNMFVLSAATGQETAMPYTDKNHGLFTYFLLKKLQDSKGQCSLQELSNYVTEKVRLQSNLVNHKSQTPTMTVSGSLSSKLNETRLIP